MTENEIGKIVVNCAFEVHVELGPGLLESVYESALAFELKSHGLAVTRQQAIPIRYKSLEFERGFVADIVADSKVVLELKSVEVIRPVHKKQLLTYLRLSDMKLGYLINFGERLAKDGISRIANGVSDWK